MFDFSLTCSIPENLFYTRNAKHPDYLQNVSYYAHLIEGKYFKGEYYNHDGENCYVMQNGVQYLLVGNIYAKANSPAYRQSGSTKLCINDISQLYNKFGESFFGYVKGIFVLVIIDEEKRKLFGFTGRTGLYKLYYCLDSGRLLISTSLSSIGLNHKANLQLDKISVVQHGLFQHPLGSRTHYSNICILDNNSYLVYDLLELHIQKLTNQDIWPDNNSMLSWKDCLAELPNVFNNTLSTIVPHNRFNCALTGGFDSRTILSYLVNRQDLEYRLYSWAADERWHDVEVARSIAQKLGLSYSAILLNNDMLDKYCYYAAQHIYWTDGLGSINRTNQMYSHWLLSQYSRDVMTGYFGSELFRPMGRHNIMISETFVDTYLNPDRKSAIKKALLDMEGSSPFTKGFIAKHLEETIEDTFSYFGEMDVTPEKGHNLLIYLIKTGFWKFFGQEFHAQRIHNRIQSPYMDDDFIDFLLKTPVWSIHRKAYRFDPRSMLRGQAFYLPILKANSTLLMNHPTNRGFSPSDFESWLFPLNVAIKHHFHKKKLLKRNILGFNSRDWNKLVYASDPDTISRKGEIFDILTPEHLKTGFWYSLKRYLEGAESCG